VVDDFYAEECFHTEESSVAFREITAVCFCFLAVIQCWFGVKVLKMEKIRYDQFFLTNPEILSVVNIILVVSFASRSFYQIMAMNKILVLPDVPLQVKPASFIYLFFFRLFIFLYFFLFPA
jgi:hypothetical protein